MSAVQDFMRTLLDPAGQGRANIGPNVPPPTVGGFFNNVASGIGQLAQGFANIPKDIGTAIAHPETVGPGVTNVIKGVGSEVNDLVGQPVNTKTGNLQFPSITEATQSIYNKPVQAFTTLLPAAGAVGKIGKLAKSGEVATGAETGGITNWGNKVLQGQYRTVTNPEDINTVANYGFTSPNKVAQVASKVTGEDGAITQLTHNAIAKSGPVDIGGIDKIAQDSLDQGTKITSATEQKFLNQIAKFSANSGKEGFSPLENSAPAGQPVPGFTTESGLKGPANGSYMGEQTPLGDITQADPTKVFKFIQDLEKQAVKAGKSQNLEDQQLAQTMWDVHNELTDRLFGGFNSMGQKVSPGADGAMVGVIDPATYAKLHAISPQLANDVMNAKNVSELRSLAGPFVRLSQAARQTAEKVAGEPVSPTGPIEVGSTIISGNPIGLGMWVAGTNAGKNMIGNLARGLGNTPVAGASASLVPTIAKTIGALTPAAMVDNGQQNQSSTPTPPSQFQTPNYPLPNPYDLKDSQGNPTALSPTDAQGVGAKLAAQSQDPAIQSNPATRAEYNRQVSLYNSQKGLGEKIQAKYEPVLQANGYFQKVYADLQQAAPDLRNANKTLADIRNSTDPKYAALITDLTNLDNLLYGGKDVLFGAWDLDTALSKITASNEQMVSGFQNYIKSISPQSPVNPTSLPATPPAFPQSAGSPASESGTNIQAMPPMPGIIAPMAP